MKTPLITITLTITLIALSTAQDITIAEAKKLIASQKPLILDIRTPEEFAAGHIQGAKSLNFFDPNFETELAKLDRQKPILFHCKSGGRSTKALSIFKKLKFQKYHHMKEGYDAWITAE